MHSINTAQKFSLALALATGLVTSSHAATLGGYGELHLNYKDTDGTKALPPELDFHRFVLFFGHDFGNDWSFQGELELEHNVVDPSQTAKDDKGVAKKFGYLPVEQAVVRYQPWDAFGIGAGVVLVPAGMLNENHEPPRFLTVERPLYHSRIIPTTWFGNGLTLGGKLGDFNYQGVVMEGLDTRGVNAKEGIRGARQKGLYSSLASVLMGARLDWESEFGLTLGASYHRDQLMNNPALAPRPYEQINLTEYHAKYDGYGFMANFEYGNIDYTSTYKAQDLLIQSQGWYGELGYDILHPLGLSPEFYPYFHYSVVNPASETQGNQGENLQEVKLWKAGASFKPISSVSIKADYGVNTTLDSKSNKDVNTAEFNVGVGYQF